MIWQPCTRIQEDKSTEFLAMRSTCGRLAINFCAWTITLLSPRGKLPSTKMWPLPLRFITIELLQNAINSSAWIWKLWPSRARDTNCGSFCRASTGLLLYANPRILGRIDHWNC
jgi:hypothetical protein